MPHRAIQDGHVMVESSDKRWSTGERNGKPFQYSCLENHMNSMEKLITQNSKTRIMPSGPITSWQIDGEIMKMVRDFILGAPKSPQMVIAAMILKDTCSLEGKL